MSAQATTKVTLREFIDSSRIGGRQKIIVLLMFLVMIADGMDITLVSHLFPQLIKGWGVSIGAITLTVAASVVAMATGALLSGPAGDRWGRKGVTIAGFVLFCLATAALGLAQNIEAFMAFRIVSCLGLGAVMPLAMAIVADWMPTARRAQMVTLSFSGVALGSIIGAFLSATIIPALGWQALALIAGLAPLVIAPFLIALVPEAPSVLVALGRPVEQVRRTLSLIAPDRDISGVDVEKAVATGQRTRSVFAIVFSRPLLATTLLLWAIFFLVQGLNLLILQYLPILLQRPDPGLTTAQSGAVVAVWGWGGLIGQVLVSLVLRTFDRFWAAALVLLWGGIGLLVMASVQVDFVGLLVLIFAIGLGLPAAAAAIFSLAALAYPTEVRATGLGAAGFAGRIGTLASGVVGGAVIAAGWSLSTIFLALSVPVALAILAVLALRGDTRRREARQGAQAQAPL